MLSNPKTGFGSWHFVLDDKMGKSRKIQRKKDTWFGQETHARVSRLLNSLASYYGNRHAYVCGFRLAKTAQNLRVLIFIHVQAHALTGTHTQSPSKVSGRETHLRKEENHWGKRKVIERNSSNNEKDLTNKNKANDLLFNQIKQTND